MMSSAFFRNPNDDSTDSSHSDGSIENLDHSQPIADSVPDPDIELMPTESLSTEASVDSPDRQAGPEGTSIPNADRHRDFMFASLLEEFFKTRAAELINIGSPGSSYHRSSPEVQPLARKLYGDARQALASNSILPAAITADNASNMRKQYLAGLDDLSLRKIEDRDLTPAVQDENSDLALANAGRRGSAEIIKAFDPAVSSILMQTGRMSLSSPRADMQMAFGQSSRSHYESSFQQIRMLGKGGFGRVYHAYNIFDKKEYAVKKIPLSAKLSQRYRQSGHEELESVLREVQALAQLEHSNCVRYHACWVEEPRLPTSPPLSRPPAALAKSEQRLLTSRPHVSSESPNSNLKPLPRAVNIDHSDGIVFGYDNASRRSSQEPNVAAQEWSVAGPARDSSILRDSEIFTDDQARVGSDASEVSIDHSVYVLHVQMSMYPLTLKDYFAPPPTESVSALSSPPRRHCFHLVPSLRILLGILCGLQYIHAKGLIHRDIKPGNVFLSTTTSKDGISLSEGFWDVGSCPSCPDAAPYYVNPRIGDFGLVADLVQAAAESPGDVLSRSPNGRAVGTEFYRPPSRGTDDNDNGRPPVDEKLDVFALGVTLVELLCAFSTSSERMHVLKDLLKERLPVELAVSIDSEGHVAGTGKRVADCIRGMTKPDARERWGCARVKDAVDNLLQGCRKVQDGSAMKKLRSLSESETDVG